MQVHTDDIIMQLHKIPYWKYICIGCIWVGETYTDGWVYITWAMGARISNGIMGSFPIHTISIIDNNVCALNMLPAMYLIIFVKQIDT